MLTEDELNLLYLLGPGSRGQAIDALRGLMNTMVDEDYIRLCIHTLRKLKAMSDADYAAVILEIDRRG